MDKRELYYISNLKKVLSTYCDDDEYGINEEKDCAICLIHNGAQWEVYDKERNTKNNRAVFGNVIEACIEMIHRMFYGNNADLYVCRFFDTLSYTCRVRPRTRIKNNNLHGCTKRINNISNAL